MQRCSSLNPSKLIIEAQQLWEITEGFYVPYDLQSQSLMLAKSPSLGKLTLFNLIS